MAQKTQPTDIDSLSFEEALAELEAIVRQLEKTEGRLDEAIGAYERGAQLKKHCEKKLSEAKAKVDRITLGPDGNPAVEPTDIG